MRSLIIAVVAAFAFVCATGASSNAVGGAGPTRAVEIHPVAHCFNGSVACGKTCIPKGKVCPRRPNLCAGVMCPMFIRQCPAGTVWGKAAPGDCCNNACIKVR